VKELYEHANSDGASSTSPTWLEVQRLAFNDDADSFQKLTKLVLDAERTSIRLPIIRTALKDRDFGTWTVKKGDTVILDIVCFALSFSTD
jgi:hypothetical protein